MERKFSDEFKEQVLKECRETGNAALVARRHDLSPNTVHTWRSAARKRGSTRPLSKDRDQRQKATEKRLQEVSTENDNLKRLLADKELELAILRELRDSNKNPR